MKRGLFLFLGALATMALIGSATAEKLPTPDKKPAVKSGAAAKDSPEPPDPQAAIQMANDYFNSAQVMTRRFRSDRR